MLYREVPKTGDKLSVLGYGAMRLPTKMVGVDEDKAKQQMHSAIDRGVNYIDTAYPYHNGKSEEIVGRILAEDNYRQKVKLATKLPHWKTESKEEMHKILDEQLEKLQTDYIDYYLVHNLNGNSWDRAKKNGVIEFLDEALASGKIINAGFSYHGAAEDFKQVIDDYDWIFCQIQYNFLDTDNQAGTAGMKYAASKGIAVMVMEPLRGGNLAVEPPKEIKNLWKQSKVERTPVEWSLRWILNNPEITLVLSGMNVDAHIDENIRIASAAEPNSLTDKELELVNQVADTYREIMKVGCTSCQYCMPCPAGVDIPSCFEKYNSYHMFNDRRARLQYLGFNGGLFSSKISLASQCVDCGQCVTKCPQNINIPEELKGVEKDLEGILGKPIIWIAKKIM